MRPRMMMSWSLMFLQSANQGMSGSWETTGSCAAMQQAARM
jgi:hypothetical protein